MILAKENRACSSDSSSGLSRASHTGWIIISYRQSVLTIRLDDALGKLLEQVCSNSGRNRSDVVRDALRRQLEVATFDQLRACAMPFAESRGFLTDEDVFKSVS